MKYYLYIALLFLFACANKPKDLADKACDCVKSEGMNTMMGKPSNKMEKCLKGVVGDVKRELKGKNKREKSLFAREFLKGVIDSDCSNMVLQFLPEKQLLKSLEDISASLDEDFNLERLIENYTLKNIGSQTIKTQDKNSLSELVCDCLELEKDIQLEKSLGTSQQKIKDTYGSKMYDCETLFKSEDPKLLKSLAEECY